MRFFFDIDLLYQKFTNMKNYKLTIRTFTALLVATLIFSSCSEETAIETNYVLYQDGETLSFSDGEDNTFEAEVKVVESGYVIIKFGENKLPDLHIESNGFYVKHWMDLGEITAPNILGFSEDINGDGPNGFADFGQYTSDVELNDNVYKDVASAFVWADTIRYNVHSKRGVGIIGISDFDSRNGFQIDID